ncbi:MAG: ABC transporter [Bifidobacteriaceae bacterium]|jgi:D-methionine transport system substrate-binding protein|nr:ABC transporter [Bifidobacteriaceae bacterium]
MRKSVSVAAGVAAALVLAGGTLTGCGIGSDNTKGLDGSEGSGAVTKLKIGASPVPHGDILAFVQENLAADAGLEIEVVEYQDYVLPNTALDQGDLDANYFQHLPYLESQEEKFGYNFFAFPGVHIEPLGVYSQKLTTLEDLQDGAKVGVSNDPANQARDLRLLEEAGVIKLKDTGSQDPTISDLADDTPTKVELIQVEPKLLAVNLPDFDLSVINGNYALDSGLVPSRDALALESGQDNPYANMLVTITARAKDPALVKLNDLLHSPEVKQYISDTWADGAVKAAF